MAQKIDEPKPTDDSTPDPRKSEPHGGPPAGNKKGVPARLVCDCLPCDDVCELLARHKSLPFNIVQGLAQRSNRQSDALDRRYDAYFRRCHAFPRLFHASGHLDDTSFHPCDASFRRSQALARLDSRSYHQDETSGCQGDASYRCHDASTHRENASHREDDACYRSPNASNHRNHTSNRTNHASDRENEPLRRSPHATPNGVVDSLQECGGQGSGSLDWPRESEDGQQQEAVPTESSSPNGEKQNEISEHRRRNRQAGSVHD